MPIAKFQMPDGRVARFEVPDGTTPEQAQMMIAKSLQPQQQTFDPTEGMSNYEKFAAGGGKAIADMGRGLGQIGRSVVGENIANKIGLPNEQDIAESRKLDKALMATGAGSAGNITGNILATLPTAFIPGVNTIAGGAAVGAGLGALQPTAKDESRLGNMAIGGAVGGALPALVAGAGTAKAALYDPLANQNKIIGSTLARSAGTDAQKLAQALKSTQGAQTPNVNLSAGTLSNNEGIAALEDAIRNQVPSGELARSAQNNRNALADALRNISGNPEQMMQAQQARDAAVNQLYTQAKSANIPVDEAMQSLMQRPALQQAMKEASANAANRGAPIDLASGNLTGQTAHEIKMALDAAKNFNPMGGANKAQSSAIGDAANDYLALLEQRVPEYAQAKSTYSQMSQPINQMQIGQKLAEKLIPATSGDMPASLNYASLAKAMQNPDTLAQSATGFSGAKMANMLTPEAMQTAQGVTSDASKIAEALKRGSGQGSPTARRLAQGDMLSQYFAQEAPITSRVLSIVSKVPGANLATKGASAVGSMVGDKVQAKMLGQLDEMLANNPQQVAALIEKELSRVNPTQRQQIIRALPQSVVLALPSSVNAAQ